MNKKSTFEFGRRVITLIVTLAICCAAGALFFTQENSRLQTILVIASFALFASILVVSYTLCRCPHCGKPIVNGVLTRRTCPKCKRILFTGEKVK